MLSVVLSYLEEGLHPDKTGVLLVGREAVGQSGGEDLRPSTRADVTMVFSPGILLDPQLLSGCPRSGRWCESANYLFVPRAAAFYSGRFRKSYDGYQCLCHRVDAITYLTGGSSSRAFRGWALKWLSVQGIFCRG